MRNACHRAAGTVGLLTLCACHPCLRSDEAKPGFNSFGIAPNPICVAPGQYVTTTGTVSWRIARDGSKIELCVELAGLGIGTPASPTPRWCTSDINDPDADPAKGSTNFGVPSPADLGGLELPAVVHRHRKAAQGHEQR